VRGQVLRVLQSSTHSMFSSVQLDPETKHIGLACNVLHKKNSDLGHVKCYNHQYNHFTMTLTPIVICDLLPASPSIITLEVHAVLFLHIPNNFYMASIIYYGCHPGHTHHMALCCRAPVLVVSLGTVWLPQGWMRRGSTLCGAHAHHRHTLQNSCSTLTMGSTL
jgi:hypothetical protein